MAVFAFLAMLELGNTAHYLSLNISACVCLHVYMCAEGEIKTGFCV